jgi:tricorn protease-like protein
MVNYPFYLRIALKPLTLNDLEYRDGTAPDISVFNFKTFSTENRAYKGANSELPVWIGGTLYYISDNEPNKIIILWNYDLKTKVNSQFKDYDITFPESNTSDIFFEAGGNLYLYNVSSATTNEDEIEIISDKKGVTHIECIPPLFMFKTKFYKIKKEAKTMLSPLVNNMILEKII